MWILLPVEPLDMQKWIEGELQPIYDEQNLSGTPEEFEVVDTDEIRYLGPHASIQTYNDYLELLEEQDVVKVEYIIESLGYSISDIIKDTSVLEDLTYYECDISEYVDTMIEEGIFGEIPEHLIFYIDTEKLGRDMLLNGDVAEFSYNNTNYIIF